LPQLEPELNYGWIVFDETNIVNKTCTISTGRVKIDDCLEYTPVIIKTVPKQIHKKDETINNLDDAKFERKIHTKVSHWKITKLFCVLEDKYDLHLCYGIGTPYKMDYSPDEQKSEYN
jgi:hypothetical protein